MYLELAFDDVPAAEQSILAYLDILFGQDPTVRLVDRPRQDEVPQYAHRDSDGGTYDVHPSPTFQSMDAFQPGGCACLNQAGGKGACSKSGIEQPSSTRDLVTSVPAAENIVHGWEERCLEPSHKEPIRHELREALCPIL